MAEYLKRVPDTFSSGDTVSWKKDYADYPASEGWVLAYYFAASTTMVYVVGAADGDSHVVVIDGAKSLEFTPGRYIFQGYMEKDGVRHRVDLGAVEVAANFADYPEGYDARSHVVKMLDAIEKVLEGRASSDQASRKVGDRELRYIPLKELLEIRNEYKDELFNIEQKMKRAAGESTMKNIGYSFRRLV